jgi:hypothetical protein
MIPNTCIYNTYICIIVLMDFTVKIIKKYIFISIHYPFFHSEYIPIFNFNEVKLLQAVSVNNI